MERTTFISKFFATVLSISLAMFMFVPTAAWAEPSDATEFNALPTDKAATDEAAGGAEESEDGSSSPTETESEAGDADEGTSTDPAVDAEEDKEESAKGNESEDPGADPAVDASSSSAAAISKAAEPNWDGKGTQSSPYQIANVDDLLALANSVAEGEDYNGVYFKLTSDIDLSDNAPWTPIGTGSDISADSDPSLEGDEADATGEDATGPETTKPDAADDGESGPGTSPDDPADSDKNADSTETDAAVGGSDGSAAGEDSSDADESAGTDGEDTNPALTALAVSSSIEDDATAADLSDAIDALAEGGAAFAGSFNGGGHTISNLTIEDATAGPIGLFGRLDGANISNLKFKNVKIDCPAATDMGALAGSITNDTTISAVSVTSGTVSGSEAVGGIVGSSHGAGTVHNCVNAASVTATNGNAGGIVGAVEGRTASNSMDIATCKNSGTVSVAGGSVTFGGFGGIVGSATNAVNITNCDNTVAITANGSAAGGIVGAIGISAGSGTASPTVTGCRNDNKATISGGTAGSAGGIVGSIEDAATITKNINTAGSISGDAFAAGIVGVFKKATAPDLSVTKNVSTTPTSSIKADSKSQFIYLDGVKSTDKGIDITDNTSQPPAEFGSVYYATLQYAIDAAASAQTVGTRAQTVKLLSNAIETVVIPESSNIALDMGGYAINQASSSDQATVTVLGTLTLTTDGSIGTESVSADNPNKIGALVDGSEAVINVDAGTVAGSESAVALANGGSFYMDDEAQGILKSNSAGIDVKGGTSTKKSTSSTDDAETDADDEESESASPLDGFMSFMGSLLSPSASDTTTTSSAKPTVSLSAGQIVADPVIRVAEGVSPEYVVKGGWYSSAMPSEYVAEGYHATLAVNDTETPYTVSDKTVTFTFSSNEGSAVPSIEVAYGTAPDPRTMPTATKDGYVLEGWYTNPDFSGDVVTELPAVAVEDVTYYAKWTTSSSVIGSMAKAGDNMPLMILLGAAGGIGALIALGFGIKMLREEA